MLVYFVAALVAGVYLANVPVRVALELNWRGQPRLRFGAGIFGRARVWTAEKPLSLSMLLKRRKRGAKIPRKALSHLKRHTAIAKLEMRLSAGDACATAILCGALQALATPLARRARVIPVFGAPRAQARALCIADAPLGHIMLTALWCVASMTVWRVRAWISDQLKAS